MRIWRIEKLKAEIRNDSISDRNAFWYFFTFLAWGSLLLNLATSIEMTNLNTWDIVDSALNFFIVVVGIYLVWKSSGAENGNNFFRNFFCISVVLAIRFIVVTLLVSTIIFVAALSLSIDETTPELFSDPWYLLVELIIVAYYWRLIKHMRDVS